jgi:hypothetical protein
MRLFPLLFAVAILVAIVGISANADDTVVRCGQVSDIKPASFVLNRPGSDPLKVAIPHDKQVQLSSYVCVSVIPGRPAAQLASLVAPGMPGYVAQE